VGWWCSGLHSTRGQKSLSAADHFWPAGNDQFHTQGGALQALSPCGPPSGNLPPFGRRHQQLGELVDRRSYMLQLRRDHDRKRGFWSEVPKTIIPEAETEVKAVDKGVVERGGNGRGLQGPGVADDEAGSVQPELW
jgi:hypothetical protein